MDPGTGEYLCYNEVTEEFSGKLEGVQGAKKPFMLGKDGDIEPNLWQVRFHPDNGRLQYYNRKLPWESSFDPPQGYVLCYKCNTDFACRQNIVGVNVSTRQKIKGGKYCRKCYNIDFGRRPYVNFRNWKRCVHGCFDWWTVLLCFLKWCITVFAFIFYRVLAVSVQVPCCSSAVRLLQGRLGHNLVLRVRWYLLREMLRLVPLERPAGQSYRDEILLNQEIKHHHFFCPQTVN